MIRRRLRSWLERYTDDRWTRPYEWWCEHRIEGQLVIILRELLHPEGQ